MVLTVGMVITGDATGAKKALKGTDAGLDQVGKSAKRCGMLIKRFGDGAEGEFRQLKSSIDPVYKAQLNLERTQKMLNKAVREGVTTQAEAVRLMQQYTAATKGGAVAAGQMSRRMSSGVSAQRRMGLAVQNTSYQVGDFAVQVGMGTSAAQALAMQLPQLLGGFGILGAVMGAVVAIGIPLARVLFGAGDAAKETDENVILLSESLAALNTVSGEVTTQMREGLVEAFGGSAAAVEALLEALKAERFERAMAPVRKTIDDVIDQTRLLSDIIPMIGNADLANALPTSVLERHKELIAENVGLALSLTMENENLLTSLNAISDATGPDDLIEKLAAARVEAQEFAGPIAAAVVSGLDDMAIEAGVLEQVMSRVSGQGERLAASFRNAQAESFLFSQRFAGEEALMNMPLTADPRNRPNITPPRRTGSGGSGRAATAQANGAQKLIDKLQQEIDLLGVINPLEQEMIRLRGQLGDATAAETEKVRELIMERNAERDALEQTISRLDGLRDGARSVFDTIVEGARQGTSALDIMLNILFDIGSKLTSLAGDSLMDALFGSAGSASGGAIGDGLSDIFSNIFKFADGGVVNAPTLFGYGNGQTGLMGEAGPEAIMPLTHAGQSGVGASIGGRETTLPLTRLGSGKLGVAIQPFAKGGAFGGYAAPIAANAPAQASFGRSGATVVNNWNIRTDSARSFAESKATTARKAGQLMGQIGRFT